MGPIINQETNLILIGPKIQDSELGIRETMWWTAKPSLKIRTANAIFWISLCKFRDYGQKKLFFRNETFLFFKIESWNFQHLFEIEFRETSQNFNSFSSFRQLLFSFFLSVVWLSWNFVRFHEIPFSNWFWKFQLSILKNKKVLFLKIYLF